MIWVKADLLNACHYKQGTQKPWHACSCRQLHNVRVEHRQGNLKSGGEPQLFDTIRSWLAMARDLKFEDTAKQRTFEQVRLLGPSWSQWLAKRLHVWLNGCLFCLVNCPFGGYGGVTKLFGGDFFPKFSVASRLHFFQSFMAYSFSAQPYRKFLAKSMDVSQPIFELCVGSKMGAFFAWNKLPCKMWARFDIARGSTSHSPPSQG